MIGKIIAATGCSIIVIGASIYLIPVYIIKTSELGESDLLERIETNLKKRVWGYFKSGDYFKLKGVVRSVGKPLKASLTGSNCVYAEVQYTVHHRTNKRSNENEGYSVQEEQIHEVKQIPWTVELADHSRIQVDPYGASIITIPSFSPVKERIIESDKPIFILGHVKRNMNNILCLCKPLIRPYIISTLNENDLLNYYYYQFMKWFLVGSIIIFGGVRNIK